MARQLTGEAQSFPAGFIYGLLKEKGLTECGRLGDITAQFCIGKIGARQGLPTLDELTQRYRKLYNKPL
jgi:ribokinase